VLAKGGFGRYVGNGYLLFLRDGTLFAQRLDANTLTTRGDASLLVDGIASVGTNGAQFNVSDSGALVYAAGNTTAGASSPTRPLPPRPIASSS
jgi:hypothetical protein